VGDVYRFLATGDETGGRYATFEAMVPPGGGPPPHIHRREEESFLVLEGEVTFQLGSETIVAGPGTFLNMPVGSLHCFKNHSGRSARMLISVVPAGLERMFFEVGQPIADDADSAPPPTQKDIEKLLAIAPRYGIEISVPGR
jgi:quercetin dioxygenase-like cupin family protein